MQLQRTDARGAPVCGRQLHRQRCAASRPAQKGAAGEVFKRVLHGRTFSSQAEVAAETENGAEGAPVEDAAGSAGPEESVDGGDGAGAAQ